MPRHNTDTLTGAFRDIVLECLRRIGKDFITCDQCGATDKPLDIHHTKYEYASIYDLQLVCRSCNLLGINKGLI